MNKTIKLLQNKDFEVVKSRKELDTEEIVDLLFTDLYAYTPNIKELLTRYFDSNEELKISWSKYFQGK